MPKSPAVSPAPLPPSSRFQIFAPTAPWLESIAAGELKSLGVRGRQEIGGVAFEGDLDRICQANLWLRTASRVLVRLGQFHASTFYELERRSKKLPWQEFLPEIGSVEVRVTCRKSKLYHSDAVAERLLSVIAGVAPSGTEMKVGNLPDEEQEEYQEKGSSRMKVGNLPDEEQDEYQEKGSSRQLFVVRIVHDQCEISADSSGELLHRRGYRKEVGKAPLRETLAAAMLLASGWNGRRGEPLLDPMCGSGTIPIEAALIASGIAPGLERDFQFMHWPIFNRGLWNEIIEQARASATKPTLDIVGADRDAGAIRAATNNAERAGVGRDVRFSAESLSGSIAKLEDAANGEGWILTNPPYGVRVGESEDLRDLYATLGNALKMKRGWRIGILTADAVLAAQMRLSLRPRFSTSNGGIPVSFLASEKTGRPEVRPPKSGVGGSLRES
jgi:putative N6-adenine-specific DNA methylase